MDIFNRLCLVTGGAGFIGSHLVDRLLASGARVRVLDDFHTGSRDNLAEHIDKAELEIIEGSVCDPAAAARCVEGCEFVFHLACRNVRESLKIPTPNHDVNATGTYEILKASAAAGVKRFIYCSSSEVNGTADIVPMPEEYHFHPETIYGASKLCGEYYTQVFHRSGWLETVIARPHNNYGPREHYEGIMGEVIPRFILLALTGRPLTVYGDGRQTRDFTYVTETAEYLIKLALAPHTAGSTYNVCRGEEVSIMDVARIIVDLTGSHSEICYLPGRPNDVLRLYGDPGRLRSALGDSPSISIDEGLRKTVEWFKNNVPLTDDLFASFSAQEWENLHSEPWITATQKRVKKE